jgi:hypothetical protein
MFRLYEAIIRLYVYKNRKTLHSWRERPSPLQIQIKKFVFNIKELHKSIKIVQR